MSQPMSRNNSEERTIQGEQILKSLSKTSSVEPLGKKKTPPRKDSSENTRALGS